MAHRVPKTVKDLPDTDAIKDSTTRLAFVRKQRVSLGLDVEGGRKRQRTMDHIDLFILPSCPGTKSYMQRPFQMAIMRRLKEVDKLASDSDRPCVDNGDRKESF